MAYELRERPPAPERFVELRDAADMRPRSLAAARRGLANTVFGVTVIETADDAAETTVGMARIVGDEGCLYCISDMVVHPDHQGRGLGTQMMDALMAYIDENAPETTYITLMADVDDFYERWGFEPTRPVSKGMWLPDGPE